MRHSQPKQRDITEVIAVCEGKKHPMRRVLDGLPECFGNYSEICDDVACEICEYATECEMAAEDYYDEDEWE